jgi:hypothetical protein
LFPTTAVAVAVATTTTTTTTTTTNCPEILSKKEEFFYACISNSLCLGHEKFSPVFDHGGS